MKKKNYILVDPSEDPLLMQLLNDVHLDRLAVYQYGSDPVKIKKWVKASGKYGRRAKPLTRRDDPLAYPSATSRPLKTGFIPLPKNVTCNKQAIGAKFKFIFKHKIF